MHTYLKHYREIWAYQLSYYMSMTIHDKPTLFIQTLMSIHQDVSMVKIAILPHLIWSSLIWHDSTMTKFPTLGDFLFCLGTYFTNLRWIWKKTYSESLELRLSNGQRTTEIGLVLEALVFWSEYLQHLANDSTVYLCSSKVLWHNNF